MERQKTFSIAPGSLKGEDHNNSQHNTAEEQSWKIHVI